MKLNYGDIFVMFMFSCVILVLVGLIIESVRWENLVEENDGRPIIQ